MKKSVALVMLLVLLMTFSSSEAIAITQEKYDEVVRQRDALYQQIIDAGMTPVIEIIKAPTATEPPVKVDAEYIVMKEYKWNLSGYYFNDLVIKNTSGRDCLIEVTMYFKDKNGNIIGVKNDNQYACEDGYETFWPFFNKGEFHSVEYDITMNDNRLFDPAQSKLDVQVITTNDKVIVSAKNTMDKPVESVRYDALFLDADGEMVLRAYGYLQDANFELKPGKTQSQESTCTEPFSEVVVYVHGLVDR